MISTLDEGIRAFKTGDYTQALNLLKPFAERGDAEAQCIVGNIYHLGLGVAKNGAEALKWYKESAKQGYAVASNNLAGIYLTGDCDVEIDREEAVKWHYLSKAQGFYPN